MPPFFFFTNTDGICEFLSALQAQIGHFADIAQLGERQTEDLKVPSSILGGGIKFIFSFPGLPAARTPGRMAAWPSG